MNSIQADTARVVNASVPPNGTVITLTAVNAGSSGNSISFSTGSSYDTVDFFSPSFTVTPVNGNLANGRDSITTYDPGSTTITVNNHLDSYSWSGSATTAASIAQGLCNTINADTAAFAYATTNGTPQQCPLGSTTVTLIARQNGQGTNYPLSASSSSSMNSFSTSPSGAALTGGISPQPVYSFSLSLAPDGNVQSVNDSVNGIWSYAYDDLNRLHTAVANNGKGCIESYDRYGNRWSQQPYGAGNSCGASQLTFSGNNTTNNNRMDGYSYDAAGNLLNDGLGHNFVYDAENRIIGVSGGSSSYIYDAEGRRVRRVTGSGTVDYLYDLNGHAVTELNGSGAWNRGEIYAGSDYLATYDLGTTYFAHTDWLGTERMRTQLNGTTYSTWTSLPFGEGSSTPDPSPLHFTGKERDTESGLDYFGARYYSNGLGRFVTSDEPGADQHRIDPQSWNLYTYGRNNPLLFIDPSGNYVCGSSMSAAQCETFGNSLAKAQTDADNLKQQYGADSTQYKDAQRAIDAYGNAGVNNGVTIQVGAVVRGGGAQTEVSAGLGRKTADNPTGQKQIVTFKADALKDAGLVGHEGSHVADGTAWVKSGFSLALNPTNYATESRANMVQAWLYAGGGAPWADVKIGDSQYFILPNGEHTPAGVRFAVDMYLRVPKNQGGYGLTWHDKTRAFPQPKKPQ